MSRAVAITLDGVLRKPLDVEAQDMGGSLLFASLVDNFRVVILGGPHPESDEQFLTINGLLRYIKVEPMLPEDGRSYLEQRKGQLQRLRNEGFRFEFTVVPDPELATHLIQNGFTTLLYTHPAYSARSFRPDWQGGLRAWSDLAEEVEFQVQARAEQRKNREIVR